MPKCLICGYVAKSIQPHLKFAHNMKVSEYYEAYNAPVYDYNPADRLQKWAKEHPEEYKKKQADSGRKSVVKMNQYLSEHPEVRVEIARKGGFTTGSKNLKTWHQETDQLLLYASMELQTCVVCRGIECIQRNYMSS